MLLYFMIFKEFAENLIGSWAKLKLVKYLLAEESTTSEREIASITGVSPDSVNKVLKSLHELNLINPSRVGNSTIWKLNKRSYAYSFLQNFSMKIKSSPLNELKKDIALFLGRVAGVKKTIIFGSIPDGKERPTSDIDLFILINRDKEKRKVGASLEKFSDFCLQKYGNKLSPIVMTEKEYSKFKNKKLLEEIKKGIAVIER